MDESSKPPQQISEMFQKFAIAFKTKTFEFFADDDDPSAAAKDSDDFNLLDSTDEFISNQKVVVIKPDSDFKSRTPQPAASPPQSPADKPCVSFSPTPPSASGKPPAHNGSINTQITRTLISSLFATVSSFKASYLQLQTAHSPFDEEGIKAADRAILSQLQKLSGLKQFYINSYVSTDFDLDFAIGSCLESQVQENQSMLRVLETVVNRLQAEVDSKHSEVRVLKQNLDKVQETNLQTMKKLKSNLDSSPEVLLSFSVFDSVLRDARRLAYRFTKVLIGLMKRAGWDLGLAAELVYPDTEYEKEGHEKYALLSYICLGMFQGFDSEGFGLGDNEIICNGDSGLNSCKNNSLKHLLEHLSVSPLEALRRNSNCEFLKFCEKKYQHIIHPTMESSIFCNLDRNEVVLHSWRSLSVFYEAFVNMASSIWMLHKLAFSFDPAVEIFQVERGVDFSMVYMEDVAKRCIVRGTARPKVGFTVVPGFRIGKTVLQSQVYLSGLKCT